MEFQNSFIVDANIQNNLARLKFFRKTILEDCYYAVTTIGDLIFSNEAEAILKGLDPTDEGHWKKSAKSPLGKVNRKGTYQSSCDLAETRTEQFCEEITVPKEIVATLLLAAGEKVVSASGVAEAAPSMISPTGTERKKERKE